MKYEVTINVYEKYRVIIESSTQKEAEDSANHLLSEHELEPVDCDISTTSREYKKPVIEVKQFQMLPKRDTGE